MRSVPEDFDPSVVAAIDARGACSRTTGASRRLRGRLDVDCPTVQPAL